MACVGYLLLLVVGVRELRQFPAAVIAQPPAAVAVAALPRRRWQKLLSALLCTVAVFRALVIYPDGADPENARRGR